MGFFDNEYDEAELEKLRQEKVKLVEEHKKVKEFMELKLEVEKERQAIRELKNYGKNNNVSKGNVSSAIKDTFQGLGNVLGEMASNSKANEEKALKTKKSGVKQDG